MRVVRTIPERAEAPIALTIGNFDGIHLGHQAMLQRLAEAAKSLGFPACVMTFEPHPREFFAPDRAPARLTSLREKLELLEGLGVDCTYVCRFNFELARIPPEDFIGSILQRALAVRWLLVGDDFRFGARRAGDFAMLKHLAPSHGFEVSALPSIMLDQQRVSSTAVREALTRGDLAGAAKLLGRPYSISGRVVQGDRLGRELGFPTANVQIKHNRAPLGGIFAVEVDGAGPRALQGVASLGVRPTINPEGRSTLEVHLFDFDDDIYRRHIRVHFLAKFRDEEKYPDLETLRRQITEDALNARRFFQRRDGRSNPLN
jgi:riboflavin kinase/FMN adenylyltransferase